MLKITVTVTVSDNEDGTRLFQSQHDALVSDQAAVFHSIVPPIEACLTDAHRKFLPTEEEQAADNAKNTPPAAE